MTTTTGTEHASIILDEVFPHDLPIVWQALTSAALIARWLMPPAGFQPVVGTHFTFTTRPAGAWDGTIRCEVLEVIENERLSYAWRGGDAGNQGYGSRLDTVVTFSLARVEGGTRIRLIHSGFVLPSNESAHKVMSEGWKTVVGRLDSLISDDLLADTQH